MTLVRPSRPASPTARRRSDLSPMAPAQRSVVFQCALVLTLARVCCSQPTPPPPQSVCGNVINGLSADTDVANSITITDPGTSCGNVINGANVTLTASSSNVITGNAFADGAILSNVSGSTITSNAIHCTQWCNRFGLQATNIVNLTLVNNTFMWAQLQNSSADLVRDNLAVLGSFTLMSTAHNEVRLNSALNSNVYGPFLSMQYSSYNKVIGNMATGTAGQITFELTDVDSNDVETNTVPGFFHIWTGPFAQGMYEHAHNNTVRNNTVTGGDFRLGVNQNHQNSFHDIENNQAYSFVDYGSSNVVKGVTLTSTLQISGSDNEFMSDTGQSIWLGGVDCYNQTNSYVPSSQLQVSNQHNCPPPSPPARIIW